MKRLIFLSLCAVSTICIAAPVSVETAKEKAAKFLTAHSTLRRAVNKSELTLAYSGKNATTGAEVLYVFNRGVQEGFVIASGDDCAEPVLGFSDTGSFNAKRMAPATKWWLEGYQQEIAFAARYGQHTQPRRTTNYVDIAPMIETMWDQEAPYYNLCPIDESNGKRGWACCVAVATAQVMYYHKWPEHGTGSHSYEWQGKTLSADFGSTTYQWDKMQNTYSSWSEDPDNAIATLMYHCGVALEVNYGGYGSYAMFNNGYVMETYFGYSPGWKWYYRDEVGDEVFEDALYNDLAQGLPVLYGGQDLDRNEGHQFVCDGYREGGYYHMNWGWSGWNDGYFLLSALNIRDGRKWNWQQEIFCGIKKPDETEHPEHPTGYPTTSYELSADGTTLVSWKGSETVIDMTSDSAFDGVTTIGYRAFFQNTTVQNLKLAAGTTTIDRDAFYGLTSLATVSLPASLRDIEGYNFVNCNNLTNFDVSADNPLYSTSDGVLFKKDEGGIQLVVCGKGKAGTYTIPDKVTIIGENAFYNCDGLTTINLGKNVQRIDLQGFYDCSNLKEIVLPEGLTYIGDYAFTDCESLSRTVLPSSINSIGSGAFLRCYGLVQFTCLSLVPPETDQSTFKNTPLANVTLRVPGQSLTLYKQTYPWSQFGTIEAVDETPADKKDAWFMVTNDSREIPMQQVSMLVAADDDATFAVLDADGNILADLVKRARFVQKSATSIDMPMANEQDMLKSLVNNCLTLIGAKQDIYIYNVSGVQVQHTHPMGVETTVDVSRLTTGTYIVKCGQQSFKFKKK